MTAGLLLDLGFSRKMIESWLRDGRLIGVVQGVYVLPGIRLTEKGRWRAALSATGARTWLSHRTALALHGLVAARGPVELIRRAGTHQRGSSRRGSKPEFGLELVVHQTRSLPVDQLTEVEGFRATTVERAMIDFASEASRTELGKALSQGERERKLCWSTLIKLIASSNGRRGLGALRAEVAGWLPEFADASSDPEEDFLRMLRRHRLPMPLVNVPIGPYRADFYWPDLRLVVELDPWGTHNGRERFRRDHRKSVEIEAEGIRVIRFTWEDQYHHEPRTARELERIIHQQEALLGGRARSDRAE